MNPMASFASHLPDFLSSLKSAVDESVLCLRLLKHSSRYEEEERGWAGGSAPHFILVASEVELRTIHEYWDAHSLRMTHQLQRIASSYLIDQRREEVYAARSLAMRREALAQLNEAVALEAQGVRDARAESLRSSVRC